MENNPAAQDFANQLMSMNREDRRKFQKKEKLSFKIFGSNAPIRSNIKL